MLYAVIGVIACLLIFVLVSFLISMKKYTFQVEGKQLRIENKTAHLKIFVDNILINDYYMPQLIRGERFKLEINEKEVEVVCRSSAFGYRMSVQIFVDGKKVDDNGVVLKDKKPKKQKIKLGQINSSLAKEDDDSKEIESKIEIE